MSSGNFNHGSTVRKKCPPDGGVISSALPVPITPRTSSPRKLDLNASIRSNASSSHSSLNYSIGTGVKSPRGVYKSITSCDDNSSSSSHNSSIGTGIQPTRSFQGVSKSSTVQRKENNYDFPKSMYAADCGSTPYQLSRSDNSTYEGLRRSASGKEEERLYESIRDTDLNSDEGACDQTIISTDSGQPGRLSRSRQRMTDVTLNTDSTLERSMCIPRCGSISGRSYYPCQSQPQSSSNIPKSTSGSQKAFKPASNSTSGSFHQDAQRSQSERSNADDTILYESDYNDASFRANSTSAKSGNDSVISNRSLSSSRIGNDSTTSLSSTAISKRSLKSTSDYDVPTINIYSRSAVVSSDYDIPNTGKTSRSVHSRSENQDYDIPVSNKAIRSCNVASEDDLDYCNSNQISAAKISKNSGSSQQTYTRENKKISDAASKKEHHHHRNRSSSSSSSYDYDSSCSSASSDSGSSSSGSSEADSSESDSSETDSSESWGDLNEEDIEQGDILVVETENDDTINNKSSGKIRNVAQESRSDNNSSSRSKGGIRNAALESGSNNSSSNQSCGSMRHFAIEAGSDQASTNQGNESTRNFAFESGSSHSSSSQSNRKIGKSDNGSHSTQSLTVRGGSGSQQNINKQSSAVQKSPLSSSFSKIKTTGGAIYKDTSSQSTLEYDYPISYQNVTSTVRKAREKKSQTSAVAKSLQTNDRDDGDYMKCDQVAEPNGGALKKTRKKKEATEAVKSSKSLTKSRKEKNNKDTANDEGLITEGQKGDIAVGTSNTSKAKRIQKVSQKAEAKVESSNTKDIQAVSKSKSESSSTKENQAIAVAKTSSKSSHNLYKGSTNSRLSTQADQAKENIDDHQFKKPSDIPKVKRSKKIQNQNQESQLALVPVIPGKASAKRRSPLIQLQPDQIGSENCLNVSASGKQITSQTKKEVAMMMENRKVSISGVKEGTRIIGKTTCHISSSSVRNISTSSTTICVRESSSQQNRRSSSSSVRNISTSSATVCVRESSSQQSRRSSSSSIKVQQH